MLKLATTGAFSFLQPWLLKVDKWCEDRLGIATAGGLRANFGTHGIESSANVYTGNTSAFRNYGGTWRASTGITGNGFIFTNTADSVDALELSAAGALTHRSNYIQTAGYGKNKEQMVM